MEDRQDAGAVSRLRDAGAGPHLERRRQHEPEQLRDEEGQRRGHRLEAESPGESPECPAARQGEHHGGRELTGRRASPWHAEGDDQRVVGRPGVERQKEHDVGRDERPIQRPSLGRGRCRAVSPREHHEQTVVLSGVVPRAPGDVAVKSHGIAAAGKRCTSTPVAARSAVRCTVKVLYFTKSRSWA